MMTQVKVIQLVYKRDYCFSFCVTEEAMEDNLYDTFAKLRAKGLARAMANTKQVKAAKLYNNGFS